MTLDYQTNLIKLYDYRYQKKEFTDHQYFSIKNVIENQSPDWLKDNLRAFEAYILFYPDRIVSLPPFQLETAVLSHILNTLSLPLPKKFSQGWRKQYLPELTRTVLSGVEDKLIFNVMQNFFRIGAQPNFKKVVYSDFMKNYSDNVKFLKKTGFPFRKWTNEIFFAEKKIEKEKEITSIQRELEFILAALMGSRSNPGIISNPKKLYSRISPYLSQGKRIEYSSLLPVIDVLQNSAFSCDSMTEEYYRNQLKILSLRLQDISPLPDLIRLSFWERKPETDMFLGSEIDTCLSVSRGSFFCILEYLMDFFMNVIKIETDNAVIGLIYVFICLNEKNEPVLLIDNIELADKFKRTSIFTVPILEYLQWITNNLGLKTVYLGMNYNDIILPPLPVSQVYLKKLGNLPEKKVYMDTFFGYSIPDGKVNVFLMS